MTSNENMLSCVLVLSCPSNEYLFVLFIQSPFLGAYCFSIHCYGSPDHTPLSCIEDLMNYCPLITMLGASTLRVDIDNIATISIISIYL